MIKQVVRFIYVIFWLGITYLFLLTPYLEKIIFKNHKYLCIYTWPDKIDEMLLHKFEEETGIKIYINYYESNEELLTKLEKMPYVDCDIIIPTGYIIRSMVDAHLIKAIDFSRCNFLSRIHPVFQKGTNDIRGKYAIPLYWDVLSIGYNNQKINKQDISLDMIFKGDGLCGKKIGMIDDARQSIVLAAIYLGYVIENLTRDELHTMRLLLKDQKKFVGAYSDTQQGYFLASETFDCVVSDREHICQQMLNYPFISCKIPDEGSLLAVDNIVVSASSEKDDLIYTLINYLYSYEVLKQNAQNHCLLPVCKDVFDALDFKYIGIEGLTPDSVLFQKLKTFKNVLTHKQINDFWVKLKAR